jgi:outer membrane protein insertion porin family
VKLFHSAKGLPALFIMVFCVALGMGAVARAQSTESNTEPTETPAEPNPDREPARAKNSSKSKKSKRKKTRVDLSKADSSSSNATEKPEAPLKGVVTEIKVEGNKKIETSAIQERILSKVGQPLNMQSIRDDVQALFNMGYFEDVRISRDGSVLTYFVKEKSSISTIEYKGNEEVEDSDLKEKIGIKEFELVNYNKIQNAITEIQKVYEEKGYLLITVDYELVPDKNDANTDKLVFNIKENDKVRVRRVSFIGNSHVKDSELKAFMMTQEGGLFSFLSGGGTYKQEIFDDDVKRLSLIYLNKGYVQAKISRPEVSVTPDKKGIYISVRIEEGEQFQVGEIDFGGDLLFTKEELREAIKLDESVDFSYETLQNDLRAIEAKYGDLGYAYANIIPRTQVLEKERKVNVLYEIDKGQKVYFRKINVIGNSGTRDKVVRRELRVNEGELYNETSKRTSLANIKRLGYFEDVQFMTKTPPGRDDQMDIDIMVKERHTGQFQLGAGYASSLGPQLNVQLNENNFMGYGYVTGARIEYNNKYYQNYTLNFTDPYFMDTYWNAGTDLYYSNSSYNGYVQKNAGAALRLGHPLFFDYFKNNNLYAFVKYRLDESEVSFPSNRDLSDVLKLNTVNGRTSSMTVSLEYDKRDDRMMPTNGVYASSTYEYAGLGGDIKFSKAQANFRVYKKLFWDVVFRNNIAYGILSSNGGNKDLPFTELFRLGGPNNLRGYSFRNVGKRVFSQNYFNYLKSNGSSDAYAQQLANTVVGGQQQFYYMSELEFPLAKEAGMRAVIFYDVGQAEDDIVASRFRADIGFGIRWFSPMGPLRFEFGFPLDRQPQFGDRSNNFQFAVGSPF